MNNNEYATLCKDLFLWFTQEKQRSIPSSWHVVIGKNHYLQGGNDFFLMMTLVAIFPEKIQCFMTVFDLKDEDSLLKLGSKEVVGN